MHLFNISLRSCHELVDLGLLLLQGHQKHRQGAVSLQLITSSLVFSELACFFRFLLEFLQSIQIVLGFLDF